MRHPRHIAAQIERTFFTPATYIAATHRSLQRRMPDALWIGDGEERTIALTFDDGPWPRDTGGLLEVLARHDTRATFFSIGLHAHKYPDLVRAVNQAGHDQGLHGYYHRPFPLLATRQLETHLFHAQRVIAEATGGAPESYVYVRPPFGWFTPGVLQRLSEWMYRTVMWTVVPTHWLQPERKTYTDVMRQVSPGAILVLHESLPGPSIARVTDELIRRLKDDGYRFVTIDEMWVARESRPLVGEGDVSG
ncbi:MAG: polysaccharide deacetylase family protein [Anaerolineae bacterium]